MPVRFPYPEPPKGWFARNIGWVFDEEFLGCWITLVLIAATIICSLLIFGAQAGIIALLAKWVLAGL